MRKLNLVSALLLGMALVGCDLSEDDTGTLSLDITDAPVTNVKKVVIKLSGISLKGSENGLSKLFIYVEPLSIDLLALQGTDTQSLFNQQTILSGVYNEIRLIIEQDEQLDTYIEFNDGSQVELTVPSGSQSGLKLKGGITVPVNGSASFTIDFDVLNTIVKAGNSGKYNLKPVLRIVNNIEVGVISGTVDVALINALSCSAEEADVVYVFTGLDVTPDDIDVTENSVDAEPITTALVKLNDETGDYEYTAAFLPVGDYTVSFSCNADDEDVQDDTDDLQFSAGQNATVVAGEIATVNF